jgi:hypothetical protein
LTVWLNADELIEMFPTVKATVAEADAAPLRTLNVRLLAPAALPLVTIVADAEAPPPGFTVRVAGQFAVTPAPVGTVHCRDIGSALKLNPLLLLAVIV